MKLTARFNVGIYNAFNAVTTHYKKLLLNPSEENIHDLRVSIRRLIPFIKTLERSFANDASTSRQVKLYSDYLKHIFKSLSTVRDRQVHLIRLNELEQTHAINLTDISAVISDEIEMLTSVLMHQAVHWGLETTSNKLMRLTLSYPIKKKDIQTYIEKSVALRRKKVLKCFLKEIHSDTDIHRIRIALKKFRYTLEMSEKLELEQNLKALSLKSGQDLFGYFQDFTVLKSHVFELQPDNGLLSLIDNELDTTRTIIINALPNWHALLSE